MSTDIALTLDTFVDHALAILRRGRAALASAAIYLNRIELRSEIGLGPTKNGVRWFSSPRAYCLEDEGAALSPPPGY